MLRPSVRPEKAARLHSLRPVGAPWRSSASRQGALNLQVEFHVIRSKDIRVFEMRHGAVNGSHMDSSTESRDPDSDDVCSACVRKFQKRDGDMEASGKNWEKGVKPRRELVSAFTATASATLASGLTLHSALRAPILPSSIFGLTTWTCFGNEAADELFQTSIDPVSRMGPSSNFAWRVTWLTEL